MSSINNLNPNVAYNYQKVPGLVTSDRIQSQAGLTIAMRDRTNLNRNVAFDFPANFATPNYNINNPTLTGRVNSSILPDNEIYVGRQISY